jgi:hypothetical protein
MVFQEKAMSKLTLTTVAVVISVTAWLGLATDAQAAPPAKPDVQVVVLDHLSPWRTFQMLKPPVIKFDDGLKPVLSTLTDWINRDTVAAPANWATAEFDDSTWARGVLFVFSASDFATPYRARLYQRAYFEVTDPAQVTDLKLSVEYVGGAIVYVNGQEVTRGNVAAGDNVDLAEPGLDSRKLANVAISAKFLHKGANVVAVEIVRAPYDKPADSAKDPKESAARGTPYTLPGYSCAIKGATLTAAGSDAVVPITGTTKEMQVWNGGILEEDYVSDYAATGEPLRPLVLKGAINGWFSAKVVAGSPKPLEGLKATVSDLKQGAATIPASALRVRYAVTRPDSPADLHYAHPYPTPITDMLLESPLDVFPIGRQGRTVVPIWVTVKVPADAKPGIYNGQLSIVAKGEKTVTVPVRLELADFVLPNAENYKTWLELIESPDSLALYYDVPLWSDKHWALIEQSLRYIGEIGTHSAYLPLICHTNFGNAESMVRWIKKPDGTYDYDFTILDKYMDLVQKYIPKPEFICFGVWEVYLYTPNKQPTVAAGEDATEAHKAAALKQWELRGKGPAVTALDPATGKTELINLPRYEDPAAKTLWKPLFDQLRQRMTKRGLADKMMVSMLSDTWPNKEEVATIKEASGNLPWANHTHGGGHSTKMLYGLTPVTYITDVWDDVLPVEPSKARTYGWKRADLVTQYHRFDQLDWWALPAVLHGLELNITGNQRGIGRVGADFWPCLKDRKGRQAGFPVDRYPECFWHSLNLTSHMLVPGPTGPVALQRYEILREGLQECEARIAIESVLTDEVLKAKLPAELVQKSQEALDERLREVWRSGCSLSLDGRSDRFATARLTHADNYGGGAGATWFISSGWQERTQQFYNLAGEVVRKAGTK